LIWENQSESRPWSDAAIGQFIANGPAELVTTRKANGNLPRFFVFNFDPASGNFSDAYAEFFAPSPEHLFLADINASGDDEAFLLRNSPERPPAPTPTPAPRAHLIMRNRSGDTAAVFEVILDADSGYQAGAGGNLDDDAAAEVMVLRDNNLRLFFQPDVNTTAINYALATNARTLVAGNLNSRGILQFARFRITPSTGIEAAGPSGLTLAVPNAGILDVENSPAQPTFRFAVVGNPTWLTVTAQQNQTPTSFSVTFDAFGLTPLTTYTATILVTADPGVQIANSPFAIPISFQVRPGLLPRPTAVRAFAACDTNPPASEPVTTTLALEGLLGVPVTTNLIAPTNWLTFTPSTALMPTTLTLILDPNQRPAGVRLLETQLTISSRTNQGTPITIGVPVSLACAEDRIFLPLVEKR
jgi:hypothetical protein